MMWVYQMMLEQFDQLFWLRENKRDRKVLNGYKGDNTRAGLVGDFTTGINMKKKQKVKMFIGPNPSTGQLNIHLSKPLTLIKLNIYNLQGACIKTVDVTELDIIQLNLLDIPNGKYLIHLQSVELNLTEKWVKMQEVDIAIFRT